MNEQFHVEAIAVHLYRSVAVFYIAINLQRQLQHRADRNGFEQDGSGYNRDDRDRHPEGKLDRAARERRGGLCHRGRRAHSQGRTVAVTYANEADATAQRRLQELDSEIEKLQKLNAPGDTYAAIRIR